LVTLCSYHSQASGEEETSDHSYRREQQSPAVEAFKGVAGQEDIEGQRVQGGPPDNLRDALQ